MNVDLQIYSPVEEVNLPLLTSKGVRLSIKRDDMIHPFISGNKWRKLKYLVRHAKENHISTLVTFGGAWSNHLVATACAGAKFGFKTIGYVRGEEVNNPVLAMCRLFGMQLIFTSRGDYSDKRKLFARYQDDPNLLFIDEGGYDPLALYGCAELIDELDKQYNHIFVPCGTGTTIAGLAKGIATFNQDIQIHGVPVLKGGDFILENIHRLDQPSDRISLHTEYHFGGYAKTKPELIGFIRTFTSQTGIMLEQTYSGKMFYAIFDLITKDYFHPNDHILAIHTGGLTGFFGMYQKF